jgi:2-C-methyl-D-erythritol 2,4-cyclodiphosphate synthase
MIRIGLGKDIHKFSIGRPFVLGGVEIPFEKGLEGHSDADVLTHAVMDALLGAASLGDIGTNFPDTDDNYKDISSMVLLKEVFNLLSVHYFIVKNIDSVVTLQKPKIAEYIPMMKENLAQILHLESSCVSVKATTSEGLGFEGAGEGVTAEAVALLEKQRSGSE